MDRTPWPWKASAEPLVGLRRPFPTTFRLFSRWAHALRSAGVVLAVLGQAHAAPRQVAVAAAGTCPSAQQLADQLAGMLPSIQFVAEPEATGERVVVVEDERGLSVEVAGSRRYIQDVERRCSERASQAAVFIALMLDPLRLPPKAVAEHAQRSEPQPKRELPAPAAVPPPATVPVFVAIAPALYVAAVSQLRSTPLALGAGARWRWGRAFSLIAGLGFLSSTTLHFDRADARERLFVLDAGASWGVWRRQGGFGVELSPVLAPAQVRGENLQRARAGWRLEWGARAAVLGELRLSRRLGLFAAESALVWPRPLALQVGGIGEVGHTPWLWLGSQLGLVLRVD
jgi:hypothetical protein